MAKSASIRPSQTWSGRIPLNIQPPFQSSLARQEDFNRVWAQCQVKGTVPKVDFKKHLVLLAVARGSVVKFANLSLDDGNLKTSVVVTPDIPNHMTCAIALVGRAGVVRVNGVPAGQ